MAKRTRMSHEEAVPLYEQAYSLIKDGMKQKEAAQAVGVHQAALSNYLTKVKGFRMYYGRSTRKPSTAEKSLVLTPTGRLTMRENKRRCRQAEKMLRTGEVRSMKEAANKAGVGAATFSRYMKDRPKPRVLKSRGKKVVARVKRTPATIDAKALAREIVKELVRRLK